MDAKRKTDKWLHPHVRGSGFFRAFLVALVAVFTISCSTVKQNIAGGENAGAPLHGMIYDRENRPVPSCIIRIEGEGKILSSDVNGRFMLDFVKFRPLKVRFEKEGFEPFDLVFDFVSQDQIIYAQIISADSLLKAAQKAIGERAWQDALKFIDRADAVQRIIPLSDYLRATVQYRTGNIPQAKEILETLVAADFREPFIYLFLADICQYQLNDYAGALLNLKKFLEIREDSEIRARIITLEAAPSKN